VSLFSAQMQMDLSEIEKLLNSIIRLDVVGVCHHSSLSLFSLFQKRPATLLTLCTCFLNDIRYIMDKIRVVV
jgi:hypothetical protein